LNKKTKTKTDESNLNNETKTKTDESKFNPSSIRNENKRKKNNHLFEKNHLMSEEERADDPKKNTTTTVLTILGVVIPIIISIVLWDKFYDRVYRVADAPMNSLNRMQANAGKKYGFLGEVISAFVLIPFQLIALFFSGFVQALLSPFL
jgi:hypothetical protein